jgi:hypothetical protein
MDNISFLHKQKLPVKELLIMISIDLICMKRNAPKGLLSEQ